MDNDTDHSNNKLQILRTFCDVKSTAILYVIIFVEMEKREKIKYQSYIRMNITLRKKLS